MSIPFFYINDILPDSKTAVLNEETSKHVVQVLRMQNGELLNLTDGKGNLFNAAITDSHKKNCVVKIIAANYQAPTTTNKISIAISLLKNASRFEWFLKKATEIGVSEIIPLITERTERTHFRFDRMNAILISAMLQSQQCWLPVLHEPVAFTDLVIKQNGHCTKYIAHCEEESKQSLNAAKLPATDKLILIGPEGDFSKNEITLALTNNFIPATLGKTRLRTETAGMVAATLLCISN